MVVSSNRYPTMDHLNRLQAFRQDLYEHVLTKRRDAQQELLDALLVSPTVHSLPELSLSPVFRRAWPSLYKALQDGRHDEAALMETIAQQIPSKPVLVFPLDESATPRPDAVTLEDRGYVHSASPAVDGRGIVIGHSYSTLAYCAESGTSWTLPVSTRRVPTWSDAVSVGAEQVRQLCRLLAGKPSLKVVVSDGRYGNHRFFGALAPETAYGAPSYSGLGLLSRLRADRVLYGEPPPYSGRGRPRKHGEAFRFKDEATWPAPEEVVCFTDARYGEVELQLWEGLHAREDAEVVFSVVRAQIHLERARPAKPLWLAWRGRALPVEDLWRFYAQRSSVEASFRFRKQHLAWTVPQLQSVAASERWARLVTMAQWTLYLSRELVQDAPHPWQRKQVRLTPERVKQSLGGLFSQIGTPARPPKKRGTSPGWPVGRRRRHRDRHPIVHKRARGARRVSGSAKIAG